MSDAAEQRTRIVIAGGSEFTTIGLRSVLEREPGFEVVATIADGETLVTRACEIEPDVIVTDIDLPRLSGDRATQRLRREIPRVAILLLAEHDDEQRLFEAIRSGANAFLPKDCAPPDLIGTIRRIREGAFLINDTVFRRPAVAMRVLAEFRDLSVYGGPPTNDVFSRLTPREAQILDSIVQGRSNKEVAQELAISEQTVKNHMSSILRKLSVNDRTQAVVYALRQGWIVGEGREGAGRRSAGMKREAGR